MAHNYNPPEKGWLLKFVQTGDARPIASWLAENIDDDLSPPMRSFVRDMQDRKRPPTLKQARLLVSLVGGLQGRRMLDFAMTNESYAEIAMAESDTATAEGGAKMLAQVLAKRNHGI